MSILSSSSPFACIKSSLSPQRQCTFFLFFYHIFPLNILLPSGVRPPPFWTKLHNTNLAIKVSLPRTNPSPPLPHTLYYVTHKRACQQRLFVSHAGFHTSLWLARFWLPLCALGRQPEDLGQMLQVTRVEQRCKQNKSLQKWCLNSPHCTVTQGDCCFMCCE